VMEEDRRARREGRRRAARGVSRVHLLRRFERGVGGAAGGPKFGEAARTRPSRRGAAPEAAASRAAAAKSGVVRVGVRGGRRWRGRRRRRGGRARGGRAAPREARDRGGGRGRAPRGRQRGRSRRGSEADGEGGGGIPKVSHTLWRVRGGAPRSGFHPRARAEAKNASSRRARQFGSRKMSRRPEAT
jgi:hypothetical protein